MGLKQNKNIKSQEKKFLEQLIKQNFENIEKIEYRKFDVVAISTATIATPDEIQRAYRLAEIFKRKDCHVVMGGIYVSFKPNERI